MLPILYERAADGEIVAEHTMLNGLSRAIRNEQSEYVRRSRLSVIKGQHMIVCMRGRIRRQAGWHRRLIVPVPAEIARTGFFYML